jgi:hypothetical protein
MGRIVYGANRPRGESSMGRIVHGANRLWGESSMGRIVHGANRPWGESPSLFLVLGAKRPGRNVQGAKRLETGDRACVNGWSHVRLQLTLCWSAGFDRY